jgi:hypothetical protein
MITLTQTQWVTLKHKILDNLHRFRKRDHLNCWSGDVPNLGTVIIDHYYDYRFTVAGEGLEVPGVYMQEELQELHLAVITKDPNVLENRAKNARRERAHREREQKARRAAILSELGE